MPAEPSAVSAADVEQAAATIAPRVLRTPSAVSHTLSEITGATIAVKFENLQFTGSYKERGALNRLVALDPEERRAGVVAVSAGNFAQAVAYHAGALGVRAVIVMPATTPLVKAKRTKALGATVILHGRDLDEAEARARDLAEEEALTFLSPYDDPLVIAGQGTIALEFLADFPGLEVLVVPVGGGGLLAGTALAAREINPDITLIGVQVESHASMASVFHGRPIACGGRTIAEGIAVKQPGLLTRELIRALCDDIVVVPEPRLEEAICLLLEVEKVVAEGAAAAGLAAVLEDRDRFAGKRVGLVLTGGNIDLRLLASVIMRGLVRTGRLASLRIDVDDTPGALGRLTAVVGAHGGNIVEISHRRTALAVHSKAVEVEVAVETEDRKALALLLEGLRGAGYSPSRVDDGAVE